MDYDSWEAEYSLNYIKKQNKFEIALNVAKRLMKYKVFY